MTDGVVRGLGGVSAATTYLRDPFAAIVAAARAGDPSLLEAQMHTGAPGAGFAFPESRDVVPAPAPAPAPAPRPQPGAPGGPKKSGALKWLKLR